MAAWQIEGQYMETCNSAFLCPCTATNLADMPTEGEAIYVDNAGRPANTRLALAKATRSRFDVFGIEWDDAIGTRNGHFAPFARAG